MSETETKATHTPGPWHANIDNDGIWVATPDDEANVICDIVKRDTDGEVTDEDRANGALVAAAPDLLSCLLVYVQIEEAAAPASSSPLRERARAAIAKATTR